MRTELAWIWFKLALDCVSSCLVHESIVNKESLQHLVSASRVKLSDVGTVAFLKKRCCRIGGGMKHLVSNELMLSPNTYVRLYNWRSER